MSEEFNIIPPPLNDNLFSRKHLRDRLWLPSINNYTEITEPNQTEKIICNSWFMVNKYSALDQPNKTVFDSNPNNPKKVLRVKKIEFIPNPDFKQKLKHAFAVSFAIYNYSKYLLDNNYPVIESNYRRWLITNCKENIFPADVQASFSQVPHAVRADSLKDFIKAYKTQCQLVKQGKKKHFEMHYRSKKDIYEKSIKIQHRHIKQSEAGIKIYSKIWSNEFIKFKEKVPEIKHDCRMTMTKDNRFYLIIPVDSDIKEKQRNNNIAALDPGVKIFQTVYDSDGNSYVFADQDINKLDHLSRIADRMRKGIKKDQKNGVRTYRQAKNKKEKKSLNRIADKLEQKIKNKIKDIHRKTAKFLCEKYDTVIIPEFRTQQMTIKRNEEGEWKRKIRKDTARKMIRWGHFQFRELLKAKGEATGTKIIIGHEEWTSKTCTNCCAINHNLKLTDRAYNCNYCGHLGHRDICAARNIMLLNWPSDVIIW